MSDVNSWHAAQSKAAKAAESVGGGGEKRPREENGGASEAVRPAKAGMPHRAGGSVPDGVLVCSKGVCAWRAVLLLHKASLAVRFIRAVERPGNILEVPDKRLLGAGTAVTVDGPALPEGWAAAKDAQGRTYFWHKATKKVQWDRPTAESVAA